MVGSRLVASPLNLVHRLLFDLPSELSVTIRVAVDYASVKQTGLSHKYLYRDSCAITFEVSVILRANISNNRHSTSI